MVEIAPNRGYNVITVKRNTKTITQNGTEDKSGGIRMRELNKVERFGFNEYYEGSSTDRKAKVICILDENCVRYSVCRKAKTIYKQVSRHEYGNSEKEKCFRNATKALNKLN